MNDNMNQKTGQDKMDELLELALLAQEQGRPVDGLLQRTSQAEDIAAMLDVATHLRSALAINPREEAKAATRYEVLSYASRKRRSVSWPSFFPLLVMARPLAAVGVAMLLLLVGSTSAVVASAGALPGDPLYPVKTGWEQVQIALIFDAEAKGLAQTILLEKRTDELMELAEQGREIPLEAVVRVAAQTEAVTSGLGTEQGPPTTVSEQLLTVTERQQAVLEKVAAAAPEVSLPALEHAIEVSRAGRQRAQESVDRMHGRSGRGATENEEQESGGRSGPERPDDANGGRSDPGVVPAAGGNDAAATATPEGDLRRREGRSGEPQVPSQNDSPRDAGRQNDGEANGHSDDRDGRGDDRNNRGDRNDDREEEETIHPGNGRNEDNRGENDRKIWPEAVIDRVKEALGVDDGNKQRRGRNNQGEQRQKDEKDDSSPSQRGGSDSQQNDRRRSD